ncbi:MAG TPA: hypothetical protein VHA75_14235, partial [Rugosimonospora sp.]|nr:hypothetical protein [Rugosimonospora sp.]
RAVPGAAPPDAALGVRAALDLLGRLGLEGTPTSGAPPTTANTGRHTGPDADTAAAGEVARRLGAVFREGTLNALGDLRVGELTAIVVVPPDGQRRVVLVRRNRDRGYRLIDPDLPGGAPSVPFDLFADRSALPEHLRGSIQLARDPATGELVRLVQVAGQPRLRRWPAPARRRRESP